MQFEVQAFSADNRITRFRIDASDESDARRQIEARGLLTSAIKPVRHARHLSSGPASSRFSLLLFSQELVALLNAGLSLVEGLEALLEKEGDTPTHDVLNRLLAGLTEGKRFSTVLAEQPKRFPPLFIGVIRAAEGTSQLPTSLERYIDYQRRIDLTRNRIVSAAIYPLILLAVGCVVSAFLIGYVVPRFAEVYQGAGRELPLLSRLLLRWGQWVSGHTGTAVLTALALCGALFAGLRHLHRNGGILRLLSGVPALGERVRIYELARLYLTLGMLLEGGIPVVRAIADVAGVVTPATHARLTAACAEIQAGMPLSMAFKQQELTTPIALRMLRVGERSGTLGRMLTQSAQFHGGEIGRWIESFTRTFEPLLMAAIGLVVGTIVVLLYLPIFDLAGGLS